MKRRRCSMSVCAIGLLVAIACESKDAVPSPAAAEKSDAPSIGNAPGLSNCPSGDTELPFPYEPKVDACVRVAARKRECEAEVLRASEEPSAEHAAVAAGEPLPADAKRPSAALHEYHLMAQCECFPARRSKIEPCLAETDCSGFARCFVELGRDGWAP